MRTPLLVLFLSALAIFTIVSVLSPSVYGVPGTIDFLEYWSAFQLLRDGLNPYDESLMRALQLTVGQKPDHVIMMWNPPWTLILFSPFFTLSFFSAAKMWLSVNIILIFAIVLLVRASFVERSISLSLATMAGVSFAALYDSLALGQLGIFLAFWFSVFLWAQKNKKDILAGVSLVYLSVKPHLFLIFFIFTLIWIVRQKRLRIVWSAVGTFITICLIGYLIRHTFLQDWLQAFQRTAHIPQVTSMDDWISANLVGWARGFFSIAGEPASWPRYVIPLSGIGIMLLLVKYFSVRTPFEKLALPIIAVSVLFSPFGWYFDQSVLVVLQIVLLQWAMHSKKEIKVTVISLLIFSQLAQIFLLLDSNSLQHTFFWVPAALLLIWLIQQRFGEDRAPTKGVATETEGQI